MLEEYMESNRKPTKAEKELIGSLIKKSSKEYLYNNLDTILVRPMNDGKMGSLLIINKDDEPNRMFGEQISEDYFEDEDGINVIISLNVDNKGNLFELDIWKTDFSSLIKIPVLR
jgi:hypothetical protein